MNKFSRFVAACAAVLCAFGAFGGELDASTFAHKAYVTFSGYAGETTLTNFPALVRIAEDVGGFSYADCAQANGGDVRFSDDQGNELPSEVAEWDASGVSAFWVKVPELKAGGTCVALHWGNAAAKPRNPKKKVWDRSFTGVYGLDEAGRTMLDKSWTGAHGAASTDGGATAGAVGNCRVFAGKNAVYGNPTVSPVDGTSFTLECWFNYSTNPGGDTPLLVYNRPNAIKKYYNSGIAILLNSSGKAVAYLGDFTTTQPRWTISTADALEKDVWHHAVLEFTADPANSKAFVRFFVDGVQVGNEKPDADFVWADEQNHSLWTGYSEYTHKQYYTGLLDEVRVSRGMRGGDYAAATYANVMASDFAVVTADKPAGAVLPTAQETRKFKVTLTASAGGTVSPAGVTEVDEDGVLVVTAAATDAAHGFHSWSGDCPELERFSTNFTLHVTHDMTLSATFGTAYYLKTPDEGGDDANDGLDPTRAQATFEHALSCINAAVGDSSAVLYVSPGTYTFNNAQRIYPCDSANQLTAYACYLTNAIAIRATEKHAVVCDFRKRDNCLGFYLKHSGALLEGLVLSNAYSTGYTDCYDALIYKGHLKDCRIGWSSMAPYSESCDVHMVDGWARNCEFVAYKRNNASASAAGGPLIVNGGIVDSCIFRTSDNAKGALSVVTGSKRICGYAGAPVIRNSIFVNNSSFENGGAIRADSDTTAFGAINVENCTFVGNSATGKGGAVFSSLGLNLINCGFKDNASAQAANGMDWNGPAADHTVSSYGDNVDGNVIGVPSFKEGGYAPKGTSLTTDAGYPLAWALVPGAKDIYGNDRCYGAALDMGAAEYVPDGTEALEVNVSADVVSGIDTLDVQFTSIVTGGSAENLTYAWGFGDGGTSTEANPRHHYAAGGHYTVSLVVTDSSKTPPDNMAAFEQEAMIKITPTVCYVRDLADGTWTPKAPYGTYDTAAADLLTAFNVGSAKIALGAGVIAGGGEVVSVRAVEIYGAGPETTRLNMNGSALKLDHADALVRDFTVYNGYSSNQNGSLTLASGATASNCVIRTPQKGDEYVSMVWLSGGAKLLASKVINGSHSHHSPYPVGIRIDGSAVVDSCIVSNLISRQTDHSRSAQTSGISVTGAFTPYVQIRNTLVADCHVASFSAGTEPLGAGICTAGNTVIENCTVAGCTAVENGFSGVSGIGVFGSNVFITNTLAWANCGTNWTLAVGGTVTNKTYGARDLCVKTGVKNVVLSHCVAYGIDELASADVTVDHCMTVDPEFNLGKRSKQPYWSVRGNSPCKNAGKKAEWMEGATDLVGNPRVFGGKPDIGCYESQSGGLVLVVR